jgi:PKD repeat protein
LLTPAPGSVEDTGSPNFNQTFKLDDRTGNFPESETVLEINRDTQNGTRLVSSAPFGAANRVTATLEDGALYQLDVRNTNTGATRSIGSFLAEKSNKDNVIPIVIQGESNPDGTATPTATPTAPNQPPVARFDWVPSAPVKNSKVEFFATNSSDDDGIEYYYWDWDSDGTIDNKTQSNPQEHTFATNGTKNVTLTVQDLDGINDSVTQTLYVGNDSSSTKEPPTGTFAYAPPNPSTGQPVEFKATVSDVDGTVSSVEWDFDGDGLVDAAGENVTNIFRTGGPKQVTMIVTDNDSLSRTVTRVVPVEGVGTGGTQPSGSYQWDATWTPDDTPPVVTFTFSADSATDVADFKLRIWARDNKSATLITRDFGTTSSVRSTTALVAQNASQRTWVVQWSAEINGAETGGRKLLGQQQADLQFPLSPHWQLFGSTVLLLLVGGLFSVRNAAVGGFVTASMGGMLWWLGLLHSAIGPLAVATGLGIAVINIIAKRGRRE